MQSFVKTVQSNTVVQSILFIVLGLVLLVVPDITLEIIVYLLGAIFGISGIISLVAYFRKGSASYQMAGALSTGIFLVVIALVMFIFPAAVAGFFSILLGAVLILCGTVNVIRSLSLRSFGGSVWVAGVVIGILIAIGGVVVIWNPFDTTVLFVMFLGALLIVNGAADLVLELSMRKQLKS